MPKKKGSRKSRTSKGLARDRRIGRAIRRAEMKIRRWNRYKEEILAHRRRGDTKRWDTAGLERHIKYLESLL